jgi:hypothetical protein
VKEVALLGLALAIAGCGSSPTGTSVKLPDGSPGIGFDDLRYSSSLHRLLVPGGRSGRLDLVDPGTLAVSSISGFSAKRDYSGGHDDGPTSVEEARGMLYVTDRTTVTLVTADPAAKAIVNTTALASGPDYVRFVESTNELWVTEPSADQIEIFKFGDDGTPQSDATIPVQNGPESLVIDKQRGRAYTHRWQSSTVVLDVATRTVVAEWPNGCSSSRGIALDETRGWLFAACNEGTLTVLDVDHDGTILSTLDRGSGFDVIGYNPKLGHLYLAGSSCSCLVIAGVNSSGQLAFLDRQNAPGSTHCASADDVGHAWVCDPDGGELWRIDDRHPASL